jgi:hypothetical protein
MMDCKVILGFCTLHFSWASDNLFTGKLPDFFGTLTKLRNLYAWFSFFYNANALKKDLN